MNKKITPPVIILKHLIAFASQIRLSHTEPQLYPTQSLNAKSEKVERTLSRSHVARSLMEVNNDESIRFLIQMVGKL